MIKENYFRKIFLFSFLIFLLNINAAYGLLTEENIGEQKVLAIVVNNGGNNFPDSLDDVQRVLFSNEGNTANDFYIKNSYGKSYFTGDVFGPYDIPSTCSSNTLREFALRSARADIATIGKSFSDYDRLIIFMPFTSCFSKSFGTIGKNSITLDGENLYMSTSWILGASFRTVSHELGHNFGAAHANNYKCFDNDGVLVSTGYSSYCVSTEIGDTYSVMARTVGNHNSAHLSLFGFLDEEFAADATNGGVFNLRPLLSANDNSGNYLQMIRIPIDKEVNTYSGREQTYYSIDFKQQLGYDILSSSLYQGVVIRIYSPFITATNVVPVGGNLILNVGESFYDNINGYKITLNSIQGEGDGAIAEVAVERIASLNLDINRAIVHYDFNDLFNTDINDLGLLGRGIVSLIDDKTDYSLGGLVLYGSLTTPERVDGAIRFFENGLASHTEANGYVELGGFSSELIHDNNAFSISAFVKIQELPLEKGIIYNIENNLIRPLLSIRTDGRVEYVLSINGEIYTLLSPESLSLNEWHHVVITYDSDEMSLYIDNVRVGNLIPLNANSGLDIFDFAIGGAYLGGSNVGYGLNGFIDEFRIYARAISAVEVDNLYDVFMGVPQCAIDSDCSNSLYCDGIERCVAGSCAAGSLNINDGISCTVDSCNEATDSILHNPDNSLCASGMTCNVNQGCIAVNSNLALNPGFENGNTPWVGINNGVKKIVSSNVHSGAKALSINVTSTWNVVYQEIPMFDPITGARNFNVGDTITLSAYVKTTGFNSNSKAYIGAQGFNSVGGSTFNQAFTVLGNTEYTLRSLTFVVPAGTTKLRVKFYPSNTGTGTAFFDDAIADNNPGSPVPQCAIDSDCSNNLYCDGIERCVAGSCAAGSLNINDGISCTVDSCNEATDSILHNPDNSLCASGMTCNVNQGCIAVNSNLVLNNDFELGAVNWNGIDGSIKKIVDTGAFSGGKAASIKVTSTWNVISQEIPMFDPITGARNFNVGDTITLSAYIKTTEFDSTTRGYLGAQGFGPNGATTFNKAFTVLGNTDYTLRTLTFQVPIGTTRVRVKLYPSNTGGADNRNIYFDNIIVRI